MSDRSTGSIDDDGFVRRDNEEEGWKKERRAWITQRADTHTQIHTHIHTLVYIDHGDAAPRENSASRHFWGIFPDECRMEALFVLAPSFSIRSRGANRRSDRIPYREIPSFRPRWARTLYMRMMSDYQRRVWFAFFHAKKVPFFLPSTVDPPPSSAKIPSKGTKRRGKKTDGRRRELDPSFFISCSHRRRSFSLFGPSNVEVFVLIRSLKTSPNARYLEIHLSPLFGLFCNRGRNICNR